MSSFRNVFSQTEGSIFRAVLLLLVCKVSIWSENREPMKQLGSELFEPANRSLAIKVRSYSIREFSVHKST